MAIVNRMMVKIGDEMDGAKVVEITEDFVKFEYKDDVVIKRIEMAKIGNIHIHSYLKLG